MDGCTPAWSCSTDNQRRVWFWEAAALMKHVGGMVAIADWNPLTWGDLLRPAYAPPRMICGAADGAVIKSATGHDPAGGGAVKVAVTFTPLIGGEQRQFKMPQPPQDGGQELEA